MAWPERRVFDLDLVNALNLILYMLLLAILGTT